MGRFSSENATFPEGAGCIRGSRRVRRETPPGGPQYVLTHTYLCVITHIVPKAIVAGALERRLKTARVISDPAARALLNLDVASGHVLEQLEAITMAEGLSNTAYNVLRILRGEPDGHPRGEIAARMVVHRADVTRLIDGLVRRGFAVRLRPTIDRRLSVTRITPKGVKTLQRLQPAVDALIARFRAKLSGPELIELNRLLERLYADEV